MRQAARETPHAVLRPEQPGGGGAIGDDAPGMFVFVVPRSYAGTVWGYGARTEGGMKLLRPIGTEFWLTFPPSITSTEWRTVRVLYRVVAHVGVAHQSDLSEEIREVRREYVK